MKRCERCGVCCIVCTHIQLARWEVDSFLYDMALSDLEDESLNGWSPFILKRKKRFIPALNATTMACVYFDAAISLCSIYDRRPHVCRIFDCKHPESPKIHDVWKGMLAA
jgi:Fe-S-cluster containining protein